MTRTAAGSAADRRPPPAARSGHQAVQVHDEAPGARRQERDRPDPLPPPPFDPPRDGVVYGGASLPHQWERRQSLYRKLSIDVSGGSPWTPFRDPATQGERICLMTELAGRGTLGAALKFVPSPFASAEAPATDGGGVGPHSLRRLQDAPGWKERIKLLLEAAQGLAYMHGFNNQARACSAAVAALEKKRRKRLPVARIQPNICGRHQQVFHGDMTCSNILVTNDGAAKVADFGLSRALRGRPQQQALDGPRALPNQNPRYLAKEALENRRAQPARTDQAARLLFFKATHPVPESQASGDLRPQAVRPRCGCVLVRMRDVGRGAARGAVDPRHGARDPRRAAAHRDRDGHRVQVRLPARPQIGSRLRARRARLATRLSQLPLGLAAGAPTCRSETTSSPRRRSWRRTLTGGRGGLTTRGGGRG